MGRTPDSSFQGRRYTLYCQHPIVPDVLAMRMQVNKARCHDPGRLHLWSGFRPKEISLIAAISFANDADVPYSIQRGFPDR